MSSPLIITDDLSSRDKIIAFHENQRGFYQHIARHSSTVRWYTDDGDGDAGGGIFWILSPGGLYQSFYNSLIPPQLDLTSNATDPDHTIQRVLETCAQLGCPIRTQLFNSNTKDIQLYRRHRFLEFAFESTYMFFDFHNSSMTSSASLNFDEPFAYLKGTRDEYTIIELTGNNNSNYQYEYGRVLSESFGFRPNHIEFYGETWRNVPVGPNTPIRMFVCIKNGRVIGGSQVSYQKGVAVLFNVVSVRSERGKGIGAALSMCAMKAARQDGYRWMICQASALGRPTYHKLQWQIVEPVPMTLFIKISTAKWWCFLLEAAIRLLGPDLSMLYGNRKSLYKFGAKLAAAFICVLVFMYCLVKFLS